MTKGMRILTIALAAFIAASVARAETPPLIEAARYQDAAMLQALLRDGVDPDSRQADGATAIHWAVYNEDVDALALLIVADADVNAVNRLGASPLYLAAKSGNAKLIEQLLKAEANPNVAMPMGETPIMTAARAGTARGVELLLRAGADVNSSEKSREQTALMWAAAQGHVEVARLLINAGADLEARSKQRSRLMYADGSNGGAFDQGITERLGGFTALLFAARSGDVEMARLLLNNDADIEAVAGNETSALVIATHSGHGDLARLLLERGANANTIGAGYTALHAAILRGDLETVNALLAHGADPGARLLRPNPVQRASEDWSLKRPMVGATPYWLAASFREAGIMRTLVEGRADPSLTNEGRLSIPRNREDRDSYTAEVVGGFESSVQAAIRGDSTRGRYYVQPNPDPAGEEQLALAAVIAAAEHGVDLNHRDFSESTALHDAAARKLPNIVRELAQRGADVNALNSRGQTPLDMAVAAESRGSFFGFNTSVPGPTASEVLKGFSAVRSSQ
jgi:ankyrin repeat protein